MKKVLTLKIKDTTQEVKLTFDELGSDNPTYKDVAKYLSRNNEIIKKRFYGINFEYLNMSGKYIHLNEKDLVRDQAFRVNYTYYISSKRAVFFQETNKDNIHNQTIEKEEEKKEQEIVNEEKIVNEEETINEQEETHESSLHLKREPAYKQANTQNNIPNDEQYDYKQIEYAGFSSRFGAWIIDTLILGAPLGFLNFIITSINDDLSGFMFIFGIVIVWMYFAKLESGEQQATIGKRVVGIKVTDSQGNRISFAKASGRHFAKIISGLLFMIGYIMAAFTEKKQALHDIIADCLVLKK